MVILGDGNELFVRFILFVCGRILDSFFSFFILKVCGFFVFSRLMIIFIDFWNCFRKMFIFMFFFGFNSVICIKKINFCMRCLSIFCKV